MMTGQLDAEIRNCHRCGPLPISHFYFYRRERLSGVFRIEAYCRLCMASNVKRYRDKDKEKSRKMGIESTKKWRRKIKLESGANNGK